MNTDPTIIPCPARFVDRDTGLILMEVTGDIHTGATLRLWGPDGRPHVYLTASEFGGVLEIRQGDGPIVYLGRRGTQGGYLEVSGPGGAAAIDTSGEEAPVAITLTRRGCDTFASLPASVNELTQERYHEYTEAEFKTLEAKVKELEARLAAKGASG